MCPQPKPTSMKEVKHAKAPVLVVTGTRADYGILKTVIQHLHARKDLRVLLLATGMHTMPSYGSTLREIQNDGVPIDCVVTVSENDSMITQLSTELKGIEAYCLKALPRMIAVLGDRDEALAGALVGAHLGIPVAHIHGGDVSGSGNVDELLRHAITKLSHLHFTASPKSHARVLLLGEDPKRVFTVGAPGLDEFRTMSYMSRGECARVLAIDARKPWMLVVQHPVPLGELSPLGQIAPTLSALNEFPEFEKIILYPNADTGGKKMAAAIDRYAKKKNYLLAKNFGRARYIHILKYCDVMIGNSSSGIIEAGFFNKPVVDIGERQQGREHGKNVIHTPYDANKIAASIKKAISPSFRKRCLHPQNPYGDGRAGKAIADIIARVISDPILHKKRFTYETI